MTRSILALVLTLWAGAARADLPPGPPPGADDCTVDKQCKDGATCPTLGGEVDKDCAAGMTQKGMAQKCVQQKATIGKAVFCPGATASAKKGCGKSSIVPGSSGEGSAPLALGLTALAVVVLRRARSRRSPTR